MIVSQLVIGNKNYSSWSLRAWLILTKLGIEFESIRVPLFQPGYKEQLLNTEYMNMVLNDPDIKRWHDAAKNEVEVIEEEEVGMN